MVIATRFRNLPDGQMKEIDDYLRSGRPVIGMRTATHAFKVSKTAPMLITALIITVTSKAGRKGLVGRSWGRHGSAIMGIISMKVRGVSLLLKQRDTRYFGASRVVTFGDQRMSTVFVCHCQETVCRWCSVRYLKIWTPIRIQYKACRKMERRTLPKMIQ